MSPSFADVRTSVGKNGISESDTLLIWMNFLLDDALESFWIHSEDGEDELGGFTPWPEAVQYFLRTYAKDFYLERAVSDMDRLRKKEGEDERAFARRLTKQARTCAGVSSPRSSVRIFCKEFPRQYALSYG